MGFVPGVPLELGPCWSWRLSLDQGYGRLRVSGVTFRAHRIALEVLKTGPLPAELVVDHKCRNRSCVNPEHLEPVSSRVNTLRGASPAAARARQTHCRAGHELAGENVYRHPKRGTRECRTCKLNRRKNP